MASDARGLCERLTALETVAHKMPADVLAREVAWLERAARAAGQPVAARVAAGFAAALNEDGRAAMAANYFSTLRDSLGCQAADARAAGDAYLASVAVRLAG